MSESAAADPDPKHRPQPGDGAVRRAVLRVREGLATTDTDVLAREEPLEIRVNGTPVAVVMRTPGDDEELGLGFLLTERVVDSPAEVVHLRHCTTVPSPEAEDNVLLATLAPGAGGDLDRLRRNLFAASSCGVCGKATIDRVMGCAAPIERGIVIGAGDLARVPDGLRAGQRLFDATGGLHAAGLFDSGGRVLVVREDVGRHNAVDKVVGWAARTGRFPAAGMGLVVSGRVSLEIVQKAAAARIGLVAAVSAPSSLAAELADRTGVTLVGFLRGGSMTVYAGAGRVVTGP